MRLDNISINTSRKRERIVIWTFSKKKKNRKKYLLRMSNFAVQSVWLNRAFKFAIKKIQQKFLIMCGVFEDVRDDATNPSLGLYCPHIGAFKM